MKRGSHILGLYFLNLFHLFNYVMIITPCFSCYPDMAPVLKKKIGLLQIDKPLSGFLVFWEEILLDERLSSKFYRCPRSHSLFGQLYTFPTKNYLPTYQQSEGVYLLNTCGLSL